MALNLQELDRIRKERARTARPAILSGSFQGEPKELSLVQKAGDVLAAPLRGLEGAAQDLYGLADLVAFDALPDYEERVFGTSRTAVGGLVEGLVNFGVGFIGSGYLLPAKAFASVGRLAPIVRGATRGALTDFAVFDGHEARLSNLVQAFPPLQNPVTDYLASDPDDSEAEGRFKNVLEGLGIGAFVDLVGLGFKALKVGREGRATGLKPREVEELIDQKVPPEQLAAAEKKAAAQDPGEGVPGQLGDPAKPEAAQAPRGPGLGQPNEAVRSSVEEFAAKKGITRPYPDPTRIEVDEKRAKAIADAFEAAKHAPDDPAVQASYSALARDVREQYEFITRDKGLKVEAWSGTGEPYKSSAAMAADIRDNNHLWFLPTASAFGAGAEGAAHPMLADSGHKLGELALKVNDIFRVVHDYFGHAAEGNQFGPRGEEIAWTLHTHLFSDEALPALTAETRGQNSWVNYGKHLRRADGSVPVKGDPDYVPPGQRPFAEQKAALLPQELNAPEGRVLPPTALGTPEHAAAILRTMGVSEEQAKEVFLATRRREAPITVDLQGLPALDPRTNPRAMSPEERLAEQLVLTDLNLSRYRGPEGALQLIRAMPQVFETLGKQGDAARRTFKEQEVTGLQALHDIIGTGPGGRQRLLVRLQADASTIVGVNRRAIGYRVALQASADDAYRAMQKATSPTGGAKDLLEFAEALSFHHDVQQAVTGIAGEHGRGLGSNKIATRYVSDLFSREEIEAALHQRGGQERVMDLARKFRVLYDSTTDSVARTAKVADMARGLAGRRSFGILNEYWYNSLLGRPTTLVTAALSNMLTTIYRPLENIVGAGATGRSDIMLDSVRELVGLVHSAKEAWSATVAAFRGGGELLDPKSLVSDIHDPTKKAISPESLGVDPDSVAGHALRWGGRLVRYPSAGLNAVDQFFKQLNYRAVGRSQMTRDVLAANPGIPRAQVAAMVEEQMHKLIHRGQAYGTAQLYHRGVEDAVRSGLTEKLAVDEHARAFVTKAMASPENARLSAIGDIALKRAQEVTFTAPLTPGTLPYRYQEAVLNHPMLRIITPFVRTPTNILGFAFDRNVNVMTGLAQRLANRAFPKALAPSLESSKNRLVMDMLSSDPRRKAEATGRMALGLSTTAYIMMLAFQTDDEGRPLITGYGPRDVETRRLLEASGWQQYSIKVGDGYASYGRLDPFATIIGVASDTMNYIRYAAAEDQNVVEDVGFGYAIALASSLTNKTYLSGLANTLDMLGDPQKEFPKWVNTLAASFVPGQGAGAVAAADPLMREVRSMLDAARARWPGASDDLPPLRNVLGEPIRRAQSLGSGMNPITNAFAPVLYREVSDDLINTEFARLQYGFTPPKRVRGGLDLTTVVNGAGQNAFDRWLELHGEVKLGGRNIRASLRRLMTSTIYTRIPHESTDELASPRIQMIQSVIEDYRARAYQELVREYPELGAADRARFQRRSALKRGQETRPGLADALRPSSGAVRGATQSIVDMLTGGQ